MLVLTRKLSESIRIGDDIVVTVVQISPGKVRLGIQAPPHVIVLRDELEERRVTDGQDSATPKSEPTTQQ